MEAILICSFCSLLPTVLRHGSHKNHTPYRSRRDGGFCCLDCLISSCLRAFASATITRRVLLRSMSPYCLPSQSRSFKNASLNLKWVDFRGIAKFYVAHRGYMVYTMQLACNCLQCVSPISTTFYSQQSACPVLEQKIGLRIA